MKYAYTNGKILNGHQDMKIEEGKIIFVEGQKIISIEEASNAKLDGCQVIDLAGKYIMPGLINLHVHVPAGGKPKKKQTDAKKTVKLITSCALTRSVIIPMCKGYVKTELMSGTTTIRAVGGVEDYDGKTRDLINAGKAVGPRMLVANAAVSVPGGHMAGSLAYEATSAEHAAELTEKIVATNPDIIKLMITGGVLDAKVKGEPGELKMPPEYVKACCDVAHKAGLKVAAHVESPEGVKVALRGGVDTIEHGAMPDDEMIQLLKETGAAVVATLSPALPFALFENAVEMVGEVAAYNGKVLLDGEIECYKRCIKEGIPLGLGTDVGCPYTTHYDTWRELYYFKKYLGVSAEYALYSATLNNAKIAGIDDITGSIDVGKDADFVVTEKNPLDDLQALRNISMVVARGKVYNNPKVKKYAKAEEALDNLMQR